MIAVPRHAGHPTRDATDDGRATVDTRGALQPSNTGDLPLVVGLDHIAVLQILEVGESDAALVAGLDLAHVVLEAPEGRDRALPDDDTLSEEPDLGAAGNNAVCDITTGDSSYLRDTEYGAHLGVSGDGRPESEG